MRSCSVIIKILLCLSVFITVSGLSCSKKDGGKSSADVAVTIDGVDIPQSEIDRLIKPQLKILAEQSAQLPPTYAEQYEKELRAQVLEQTIRRYLLDQKVKEANIAITDQEVMAKIEEFASAQKEPLSLEEFKKKMEQYGQSFENVKADIRGGLARNKFMQAHWAGKIDVTEEDAKKYYDENPKQFEQEEQVRASHILIKPELPDPNTNPNADPNEARKIARTKIENLLKQLKDGTDFAELAKSNSVCPSAPNGGDLGFFSRGQTVPEFENVAFEMESGQISDIVETEYGYHIIKVTDHKQAGTISFDQAKDNITRQLMQKKQSELADEYIESLKAQANIVYPPGKEPSTDVNNQ